MGGGGSLMSVFVNPSHDLQTFDSVCVHLMTCTFDNVSIHLMTYTLDSVCVNPSHDSTVTYYY